jgi:hypothetical protein
MKCAKTKKIDRVVFYIILVVSLLVRTLFIRHSIGLHVLAWRYYTLPPVLLQHSHSLHNIVWPIYKDDWAALEYIGSL